MPRSRTYKCLGCGRSHEKPTGKNCRWLEAEQTPSVAAVPTIPAPQSSTAATENQIAGLATAMRELTANIQTMGDRMGDMEKRMDTREASEVEEEQEGNESKPESPPTAHTAREIPSLRDLRSNYAVGREVNRRLADLEEEQDMAAANGLGSHRARGKRSGAARTVRDTIINDIDWPHFHIYAPPGAEPMTFEKLSVQEFVYGFMHMIDQPDSRLDRQVMWDILKAMMEDATKFPWHNVRDFYWVLGSNVENDRMRWGDAEKIYRLRIKHAQKHDAPVKKPAAASNTPSEKLRYCGPYQRGNCPEKN